MIVTNQDGLGTDVLPEPAFAHRRIPARAVRIAGHSLSAELRLPASPEDGCECRKPRIGLVRDFVAAQTSIAASAMVGDRDIDVEFAANLGIKGCGSARRRRRETWEAIVDALCSARTRARV